MADLHHVLGVGREAGEAEIKKAFRKIALECHPDRHATSSAERKAMAASRFQAASEAYEALMKAKQPGFAGTSRSSQQPYQQYYSRQAQQRNPYGYSRSTRQYRTMGQRSGLHSFMMALSRNMSRTDAVFHVGLASLLTFGIILGGTSGEYLWGKWNRGLLFEDVQRNIAEQQRKDLQARGPLRASQPESASPPAPASAAQKAANVAAAAGRIQDLSTRKQQTQPRGLDYGSAETPYREKEAIAPTEAKEDNSEPVTEDNQPGAPAAHGKTGETNLSHSLEQRQSGQQDSHSTAGH